MAKSKSPSQTLPSQNVETETATLRERFEVILFIVVEVLCLLLFIDFLFFGFYIK